MAIARVEGGRGRDVGGRSSLRGVVQVDGRDHRLPEGMEGTTRIGGTATSRSALTKRRNQQRNLQWLIENQRRRQAALVAAHCDEQASSQPDSRPGLADLGRSGTASTAFRVRPGSLPVLPAAAGRQGQLNDELQRGLALNGVSKRYGINRESLRRHRDEHLTIAWLS